MGDLVKWFYVDEYTLDQVLGYLEYQVDEYYTDDILCRAVKDALRDGMYPAPSGPEGLSQQYLFDEDGGLRPLSAGDSK